MGMNTHFFKFNWIGGQVTWMLSANEASPENRPTLCMIIFNTEYYPSKALSSRIRTLQNLKSHFARIQV